MARAVELAAVAGADGRVDQALGLAAIAGRFGDDDLAAILDHLSRSGPAGELVTADEAHSAQPGTGGWAALGGSRGGDRVTGPAAPPVPAELEALMRRMRLPYLRKAAPDVLATARAQRWDPAEVLRVLLAEEVTGRDAATRRMRRRAAGFPSGKTFSSWRPEESSISAATQDALATLEWIGRAENLAVAGPSGTGKSHFVEALAHAAIEKDLKVAWFTLESLAAAIARAKADGSVARTVTRICRSDLIVVDLSGVQPCRP